MKARRELDALVGERVFGRKVHRARRARDGGLVVFTGDREWLDEGEPYWNDEQGMAWAVPCYSTDIAAAWQVARRMSERGYKMQFEAYTEGYAYATFWNGVKMGIVAVRNWEEHPAAICLAALKALGVEVE